MSIKSFEKRQALLHNLKRDTYCRIAMSKIPGAGVGVIAVKTIPKGVNPFRRCDVVNDEIVPITQQELETLPKCVQKMVADFFLQTEDGRYPVVYRGLNGMDLSFYLNHSTEPNLDLVTLDGPYYDFVTNRKIHPGEELLINYL